MRSRSTTQYRITFLPRFGNPLYHREFNDQYEFTAATIGDAVKELKSAVRRGPHTSSRDHNVKAYLERRDPKHDAKIAEIERYSKYVAQDKAKLKEFTLVKVAYRSGTTVKVLNLKQPYNDKNDPTVSYMNVGRPSWY